MKGHKINGFGASKCVSSTFDSIIIPAADALIIHQLISAFDALRFKSQGQMQMQ